MNPRFSCFNTTHGGQTCFRCHYCPFDTFSSIAMVTHLDLSHPNPPQFPDYDLDLPAWVLREEKLAKYAGLKVTLGFLTWNTHDASMFAANSVRNEEFRLELVGIKPKLAWVDNGSTDRTVEAVEAETFFPYKTLFEENMGISVARNELISHALSADSEYLLLLDGDIQMIPWSAYSMIDYMESQPEEVGCFGFYSPNYSNTWEHGVAADCRTIYPEMVGKGVIAWTQYGIFRTSMFKGGIKFDTDTVFLGPGWGLEDDDLYMQMVAAGYESHHSKFFRCIHRNRGGSVANIGRDKAVQVFLARQEYLKGKWGRDKFNYDKSAVPNL